jgi:TonB family protein
MMAPLWFSNLISDCLQVSLLVAVGTALPVLFRMRAPRVLLAYWQGLLLVCLLLPLAQPWKSPVLGPSVGVGTETPGFQSVAVGVGQIRGWLYPLIGGVLVAGTLIRLAWLAVGLGRLRAIRRTAQALDSLPSGVRELASQLGVSPDWYLSRGIQSPATFGIRPPTILLPERFLALDVAFQRAIAGHELMHARRRDWIVHLVEECILAVFWFHPAVAWMVQRIRLSREQTVDAEVVRLIGARQPYMTALLDIAVGGCSSRWGAVPSFLEERQLARRMELLAKEVGMSKARLILSVTAIMGLLTLAAGVGIWAFPLRASAALDATPLITSGPPLRWAMPPVYPHALKAAGIRGNVTLRVTIQKDGRVSDIENWAGNPELAQAAIEAVRQWWYMPRDKAITTDVSLAFATVKEPTWDFFDRDYAPAAALSTPVPDVLAKGNTDGVGSSVQAMAMIGTDGRVSDVIAAPGIDHGVTENVVKAVKAWRYRPATKAGKPFPSAAPVSFIHLGSSEHLP